MEKYIYKITNKINNKIYIGQTTSPKRRWKEHCSFNNSLSIIHLAILKYGKENFNFEIIEKTSKYNEREKYWIKYYNSTNRENGYNILAGGEEPPVIKGEKSRLSIYNDSLIKKIQEDLFLNEEPQKNLSKKYNVSEYYITLLNRGVIRKSDLYLYPIRKNGNERLEKEIILIIIKELLYTTKTLREISEKYNVKDKTLRKINNGNHFYSPQNILYPIRQLNSKISTFLLKEIIEELKREFYSFKEISEMYNLSYSTISRINRGVILKQKNFDYPIRPSSKRVYNPVETISS